MGISARSLYNLHYKQDESIDKMLIFTLNSAFYTTYQNYPLPSTAKFALIRSKLKWMNWG